MFFENPFEPLRLYPSMLQESLIARVREISAARRERLAGIKTRAAAEKYVVDVRKKIRRCFGPLPKRTPLNMQVMREDKCDGYTRQNIIFESRPGYFVSGCFYVPEGDGKVPAVLGACGHSLEGKGIHFYQSFCIGLAKQGYLVLITDPVSQGERWQYADDTLAEKTWEGQSSVYEHNAIGKTQSLVGDFFGTWRLWDKMRALDVLLAHPRADKDRVNVTGCSGGGTLSSYIFAMDNRIQTAAPCCYITSFLYNLENSLPCDAEQMIPNILASGLEMGDLLLARAPSPVIVLAAKYDFFDPRGAEEFYCQARKLYKLLGHENNVQLFTGDKGHGYDRGLREAMYKFFNKHNGVKASANEDRLKVVPEDIDRLHAADGDVNAAGSKLAWEFTAEKARELKSAQPRLSKQAKLKQLEKLLNLPPRKKVCHYRNSQLRRYGLPKNKAGFYGQTQYPVETQPGVLAILCRYIGEELYPKGHRLEVPRELELLIPDRAAELEVDIDKGLAMGRQMKEAWFIEPRGMGTTMPQSMECYTFVHPYGLDYMFATTYEMLGESMMGLRVYDVLCAVDLLVANGAKKITLTGRGMGAIIAAFAGSLHKNVVKVNTLDAPSSYFEMTQKPITIENTSCMVRDILKYFDWTDFLSQMRCFNKYSAFMRFSMRMLHRAEP